jgi:ATP synthase protein I
MMDPSDEARLKRLRDRLAEVRKAQEPAPVRQDHHSQAHLAWRMVIELVAGLLVGFGIGLGLDALFGTRPFMLVLFTLLGFAAGVRTMLRTAREIQTERDTGPAETSVEHDEGNGRGG